MPTEPVDNPRPRLIVIAGPNGAGKTTLTERVLAHEWLEGCEYVNPDQIAQTVFGDWAQVIVTESSRQTESR